MSRCSEKMRNMKQRWTRFGLPKKSGAGNLAWVRSFGCKLRSMLGPTPPSLLVGNVGFAACTSERFLCSMPAKHGWTETVLRSPISPSSQTCDTVADSSVEAHSNGHCRRKQGWVFMLLYASDDTAALSHMQVLFADLDWLGTAAQTYHT